MDFHNTSLSNHEYWEIESDRRLQALDLDTCWQDMAFKEFAGDVENALDDLEHLPVSIDDDWVVEEMLTVFKKGGEVSEAVSAIEDGYDPTPQTSYDFFH